MIALIEIPHQRPARLHWFESEESLIDDAVRYTEQTDREPVAGFDDAVAALADDWHSYRLVRSAEDVEELRDYTGHQQHRIVALVDALSEEFEPGAIEPDDT